MVSGWLEHLKDTSKASWTVSRLETSCVEIRRLHSASHVFIAGFYHDISL
jgi:hypothetical protein